MNLIARKTNSSRELILLAPLGGDLTPFNGEIVGSNDYHAQLLAQMQRLRGAVYLRDGAIQSAELSPDLRHITTADSGSWHLLTVTPSQKVVGCMRFCSYPNSISFDQLGVRESSIARSDEWGLAVRAAVEDEIERAQEANFRYVEVGGWALAEELRGTTEALQLALATFAWSQLMGGALGIGTVTERNSSSSILRRLGGRSLEHRGSAIPAYYDEKYRCGMELLRFDSRSANPRYSQSTAAENRRSSGDQQNIAGTFAPASWPD
jgi:hypothetical protein